MFWNSSILPPPLPSPSSSSRSARTVGRPPTETAVSRENFIASPRGKLFGRPSPARTENNHITINLNKYPSPRNIYIYRLASYPPPLHVINSFSPTFPEFARDRSRPTPPPPPPCLGKPISDHPDKFIKKKEKKSPPRDTLDPRNEGWLS